MRGPLLHSKGQGGHSGPIQNLTKDMIMFRFLLPLTVSAVLAVPALADSYDRLRADAKVANGLRWVSAAIMIQDNCEDISPRILRGLSFLNGLRSHARGLGYSNDEIKAYVDDPTEKARVDAEALSYLRSEGVEPEDAASYCAVGKDHMARRTQIGLLLR